ncbi:MAG: CehA/McbA family metallohydrolase [Calditrichia bacterium]
MHIDWQYYIFLFFPILGYAEVHYRFPFLPSFLFQKEPEIVFDLPLRAKLGRPVPLFLFVKDAHHFSIQTKKIEVGIKYLAEGTAETYQETYEEIIGGYFHSHAIQLSPKFFEREGLYQIEARLFFKNGRKKNRVIAQDNYRGIKKHPFEIRIVHAPLPKTNNWYWGDLHIHSNFTDDQVEFGAPIRETALAAQSLGLDFIAVTDHSYDLDDENGNFLKNDAALPKWDGFQQEVRAVQAKLQDFVIIPGEEVSVGNYRKENVHCLVLNDQIFHPGKGDSAEELFQNQPTLSLEELLSDISEGAIAIAAHPAETPPFSQQIILRRGEWDKTDCSRPEIRTLQILNGNDPATLLRGMELWKDLLLQGRHVGIAAGNDAHGNFNCYRQVSLPFLKMVYSKDHLLGKFRTAVYSRYLSLPDLLASLRENRTLISSGPFATFQILKDDDKPAEIGDTFQTSGQIKMHIHARSIPEYGFWEEIILYFGIPEENREEAHTISIPYRKLDFSLQVDFQELKAGYVRMEAYSKRGNDSYFCLSNPIWMTKEF